MLERALYRNGADSAHVCWKGGFLTLACAIGAEQLHYFLFSCCDKIRWLRQCLEEEFIRVKVRRIRLYNGSREQEQEAEGSHLEPQIQSREHE